jgi:hypothetical protein
MPKVDPSTGEPMSDAPEQDDESLAGGQGRGEFVDAHTDEAGSRIETSPDNPREGQPGAVKSPGEGVGNSAQGSGSE